MQRVNARPQPGMHAIAEGIQIIHVPRGIEQRLVLVLAMDVHQKRGQAFQRAQRDDCARYAADVASAAAQLAGDGQQAVLAVRAQLARCLQRPGAVCRVEQSLHPALLRAGAHEISIRASAQHEVHAVHDDGFARAGFAGKHIESLRKFNAQRFNQCDIRNIQLQQHSVSFSLSAY